MLENSPDVTHREVLEWGKDDILPESLLYAWWRVYGYHPLHLAKSLQRLFFVGHILLVVGLIATIWSLVVGEPVFLIAAAVAVCLGVGCRISGKRFYQEKSDFGEAVNCLALFLDLNLKDLCGRSLDTLSANINDKSKKLTVAAHAPGVSYKVAKQTLHPVFVLREHWLRIFQINDG